MSAWFVFALCCVAGGALGAVAFGVIRAPAWARGVAALALLVAGVAILFGVLVGFERGALEWYLAGVAGSLWLAVEGWARAWWAARKNGAA